MGDCRGERRRGQKSRNPKKGEDVIVMEEKRGLERDQIVAEGLRKRVEES